MSNDLFHALRQSRLKAGAGYELPGTLAPPRVTLYSSAIDVMTDLRRIEALTTTDNVSIEIAEKKMIDYGVRSLIVVDARERVSGILTATDLLGDKPMQLISERGGTHAEILVRDIMTPASRVDVIDLKDVMSAKVGDVLETLRQSGRQHALVVDETPDAHQVVCGIFSSTQIARQMSAQARAA